MRTFNSPFKVLVSLVALLAAGAAAVTTNVRPAEPNAARGGTVTPTGTGRTGADDPAARGKYLVMIAGCSNCHTSEPGRPFAGHPDDAVPGAVANTKFTGPWGVSYAANLTPDPLTGIGTWSEEDFVNAIRHGKHWGEGRDVQQPMPWAAYAQMTDGDLKAVYAYLRSLPAVRNAVPDYEPPLASNN
jgi:mono/diheme cytochrome c family protein